MDSTKGLPAADPARYATLPHPGDALSYDMFTQAARAVGPDRLNADVDPLGGLAPRLMIATGGSQSAMRLGSYMYLKRWDAAVDRAGKQGLLLEADEETLRNRGRRIAADLWA